MPIDNKVAPRPSQEQRSEATRARLIDAAISCIAEKGYVGASSAEISERAGVSSGARVHHFKAKLDLVIAAVRFAYEDSAATSTKASLTKTAADDPLHAYVSDAYRFYSEPRYLMHHEVINAARTSQVLMDAVLPAADAYRSAVDTAWLATFERAGKSHAWSIAAMQLSVVFVRGLAQGSFLRGRAHDAERLRQWEQVMRSYTD